ncbi:ATP-dependent DNA helicase RecG [Kineosporiaceae bacterium SCSIO 59966]|nr:ATP-dependent DNA helicase RecG [Kineosporiaceae bacterium SCSIO 59966]
MSRMEESLTRVLGPRTAKAMESALGLRTVGDLLRHYPRRYAHRGELTDLGSLVEGEHVTVVAEVVSVTTRRMRNRPGWLGEAVVTDGRGRVRLTFFYRHEYMADLLTAKLRPGTTALFSGKVESYRDQLQLTHPDFEPLPGALAEDEAQALAGQPLPIYPASARLQTWSIERSVHVVLDTLEPHDVPDPLPVALRERDQLPSLLDAFHLVHRPTDLDQVERGERRLRYEEAFLLQTALARRRAAAAVLPASAYPPRDDGLLAAFDARLPFTLTAGQRRVGDTIAAELSRPHPMHRLLQGEVGSGKTLVALRAMLQVVDGGAQAALLAPTEVLAVQHQRSITAMLGDLAAGGMLGGHDRATRVALLTGAMPAAARRAALLDIAGGAAGIVVGTHALLQEHVEFADLGLVVVDEQHRFGVEQRDALRAKAGAPPHVLVMTATPIPRTVAMTVFGDLELSTLTELPAGRQPIRTHVVQDANERWVRRVWQRVREEVDAGHQAYVVCPRIGGEDAPDDAPPPEEDDAGPGTGAPARRPGVAALDVVTALRAHPDLAGLRIEVLHGRLGAEEKDAVMAAFAAGDVDVLVATTVVEVGVDVPNATTMVVLDADRFGVSQLHQLRGRVGRGSAPGLCLLVTGPAPAATLARVDAVAGTTDGFRLSEIDLEQRREGDVLGAAQSGGRSSLRKLRLRRDEGVIAQARRDAAEIVAADPELTGYPELAAALATVLGEDRQAFLERG